MSALMLVQQLRIKIIQKRNYIVFMIESMLLITAKFSW